jgi:hypothetical protein
MSIMKKIIKLCSKTWENAIHFNVFLPTGMIPYGYHEVK